MARFTITVTSIATSEVKDNETGKIYVCKNDWYKRDDDIRRFYVNVKNVKGKQMKDHFSFPYKGIRNENGKYTTPVGLTCNTDLAGKRASAITEDMFE